MGPGRVSHHRRRHVRPVRLRGKRVCDPLHRRLSVHRERVLPRIGHNVPARSGDRVRVYGSLAMHERQLRRRNMLRHRMHRDVPGVYSATKKGSGSDGICGPIAGGHRSRLGVLGRYAELVQARRELQRFGRMPSLPQGHDVRADHVSRQFGRRDKSAMVLGNCAVDTSGVDCAPYLCQGSGCASPCASDAQCISGDFCDQGACKSKGAPGRPCTIAGECGVGILRRWILLRSSVQRRVPSVRRCRFTRQVLSNSGRAAREPVRRAARRARSARARATG